METTNFPESAGSGKLSGTSTGGGAMTGMGSGTTGSAPKTGPQASAASTSSMAAPSSSPAGISAERLTSMAHDSIDKFAELAKGFSGSSTKAVEAGKTMVQDKPMVALGAAVAIGLLLGRMTSR